MNIAIIFAGGTGVRMESKDTPKQFLKVKDKEIIIYTLEVFQNNINIDAIICVCLKEWIPYLSRIVGNYNLNKIISIVGGGINPQQSQYFGLLEAEKIANSSKDIVLIHDGVRPLVSSKCIDDNIKLVLEKGSAITCVPAIETVVEINIGEEEISNIFERSKCMVAKAPQSFFIHDLITAHRKAIKDNKFDFVDSASMMKYYGYSLYPVLGSLNNIKVTTPIDYELLKAIL